MNVFCRHCGRPSRTDLAVYICPCGRSAIFKNELAAYQSIMVTPNLWERFCTLPPWAQNVIGLLFGYFIISGMIKWTVMQLFDTPAVEHLFT
jgi:hypothetical protein